MPIECLCKTVFRNVHRSCGSLPSEMKLDRYLDDLRLSPTFSVLSCPEKVTLCSRVCALIDNIVTEFRHLSASASILVMIFGKPNAVDLFTINAELMWFMLTATRCARCAFASFLGVTLTTQNEPEPLKFINTTA